MMLERQVVLVADDNADAADSLGVLLGFAGHEVHIAYDGCQAIAVARNVCPTVAVLDIGMPGATGYEVASWIRTQRWGGNTRLIALTAYDSRESVAQSFGAGFDVHLTKPSGYDEVLDAFAWPAAARPVSKV